MQICKLSNLLFQVGDHIEKIGDTSLVGWRHVDVAKYLKEIQVGETFTLRLISPLQAGFCKNLRISKIYSIFKKFPKNLILQCYKFSTSTNNLKTTKFSKFHISYSKHRPQVDQERNKEQELWKWERDAQIQKQWNSFH